MYSNFNILLDNHNPKVGGSNPSPATTPTHPDFGIATAAPGTALFLSQLVAIPRSTSGRSGVVTRSLPRHQLRSRSGRWPPDALVVLWWSMRANPMGRRLRRSRLRWLRFLRSRGERTPV
jgi:hypothetical protein